MLTKNNRLTIFLLAVMILQVAASLSARCAVAAQSVLDLDKRQLRNFDEMSAANRIRALVPYSKTFYFLDGAHQRGLTYDLLKEFEKFVNRKLKRHTMRIHVIVIPTKRELLFEHLVGGRGDIAAGNLTITPQRLKQSDFAAPLHSGIDEIIVTGPKSPPIKTIDDLAAKEIFVRASSSYYDSLVALNAKFRKAGRRQMKIKLVDDYLEDEDLLEMMNARLIPMIVIDSHKGKFWSQIFPNLTLHPDIKIRTGGEIAWAIRKKSPKLKSIIDQFVKSHKRGTLTGNILFKRYLQNTKWVRNALNRKEFERFRKTLDLFKKYSARYDFDWLMVAALAYQESRIDQSKRSPAGAIGVMQILPSTAADPNVNIPDIEKMENNIHAGVKYLRFLCNRYFEKEPMDTRNKMLFTFASYNAGAGKIAQLRNQAQSRGLDPNVWFRNVEIVAAQRIGRETVQYVSNIYKYYIAYRLILDKLEMKAKAKKK